MNLLRISRLEFLKSKKQIQVTSQQIYNLTQLQVTVKDGLYCINESNDLIRPKISWTKLFCKLLQENTRSRLFQNKVPKILIKEKTKKISLKE